MLLLLLLLIVFIPHFFTFLFSLLLLLSLPPHPVGSLHSSIHHLPGCVELHKGFITLPQGQTETLGSYFLNNNFEENNHLGKRQRLVWKLRDRKTFYLFCALFQKKTKKQKQISFHRVSIRVVKVSPFSLNNPPPNQSYFWVFSLLF
jgi:hypothetical protein